MLTSTPQSLPPALVSIASKHCLFIKHHCEAGDAKPHCVTSTAQEKGAQKAACACAVHAESLLIISSSIALVASIVLLVLHIQAPAIRPLWQPMQTQNNLITLPNPILFPRLTKLAGMHVQQNPSASGTSTAASCRAGTSLCPGEPQLAFELPNPNENNPTSTTTQQGTHQCPACVSPMCVAAFTG